MDLQDLISFYREAKKSAEFEFGIGSEDQRDVFKQARKDRDLQEEGPKMTAMLGTYRTPQVIKDILGVSDKTYAEVRKKKGVSVQKANAAQKVGSVVGAIGADLTQDQLPIVTGKHLICLL